MGSRRARGAHGSGPSWQPPAPRIITPGVPITTSVLGNWSLLPHDDPLARSTESESANAAVREHWAAVGKGERPPLALLPAAGGRIVTGAQMKRELMSSSIAFGTDNVYARGLEHDTRPGRHRRRASPPRAPSAPWEPHPLEGVPPAVRTAASAMSPDRRHALG